MPLRVCSPRSAKVGGAAEHHVAHRRRRPQLAVGGGLLDPGREVHRDPRDVAVVVDLDLARVHTGADRDVDRRQVAAHRSRAVDALRRTSKTASRPSPVLFTARPPCVVDQLAGDAVVLLEHRAPRRVAQLRRPLRRADDVGEQHGREAAGHGRHRSRARCRNSMNTSAISRQLSMSHGKWSSPGNSTYLASGTTSARTRPPATWRTRSPFTCMTSVGAVMRSGCVAGVDPQDALDLPGEVARTRGKSLHAVRTTGRTTGSSAWLGTNQSTK